MQTFGHNINGPKIGQGLCPFFGEGIAGSPSNTKWPGLRPSSISSGILIHAAIWPQEMWTENWVGAVPLWGGGAGFPCNTMWPRPRPTCMPRFIFIRPTVWPQCTNVTDRQTVQDRTDNEPIAQGEPFYKRSPNKLTLWRLVVSKVRLRSEYDLLQNDSEAVDVSFLSSVDRSSCHTQQFRCCPQLTTVKLEFVHLCITHGCKYSSIH